MKNLKWIVLSISLTFSIQPYAQANFNTANAKAAEGVADLTPNQRRALEAKKNGATVPAATPVAPPEVVPVVSAPPAKTVAVPVVAVPTGAMPEKDKVVMEKSTPQTTATTQVAKLVFGTGVTDRKPTGVSTGFDSSAGSIICWTEIMTPTPPTQIQHVWYHNGEKKTAISLKVASSPTRTWSKKTVSQGAWKVEVVDETGVVLTTSEFKVY